MRLPETSAAGVAGESPHLPWPRIRRSGQPRSASWAEVRSSCPGIPSGSLTSRRVTEQPFYLGIPGQGDRQVGCARSLGWTHDRQGGDQPHLSAGADRPERPGRPGRALLAPYARHQERRLALLYRSREWLLLLRQPDLRHPATRPEPNDRRPPSPACPPQASAAGALVDHFLIQAENPHRWLCERAARRSMPAARQARAAERFASAVSMAYARAGRQAFGESTMGQTAGGGGCDLPGLVVVFVMAGSGPAITSGILADAADAVSAATVVWAKSWTMHNGN